MRGKAEKGQKGQQSRWLLLSKNDAKKVQKRKQKAHLQLPITRGQDCQSIGKLRNIIGHLALIVNLESKSIITKKVLHKVKACSAAP